MRRASAVVGSWIAILIAPGTLFAAEPLLPPPPPPPAATPSPDPPAALPPPAAPPPGVAPTELGPPEATPPATPPPPVGPSGSPPATTAPDVAEPDAATPPPPAAVAPSTGVDSGPRTAPSPASPPRPYQSAHGLFFQAAVGAGALIGSNTESTDQRSFSGVAVSWNLLFGGTMHRRWAGGAGISREHVPAPSSHDEVIDGDEPNLEQVSFALDSLVAFADFHPFQDGFHALGQVGFAYFSADRGTGIQSAREPMLVGAIAAGYDFKLPGALSVGGLVQFTFTRQEMWEGARRVDLNLFFPSLMLTAAYR